MSTLSIPAAGLEDTSAASMPLYTIDPLSDSRWDDFVANDPRASVFHQRGWLKALASTYSYEPVVLTSAPAGQRLTDGIVFCQVKSWITGSRLVSLPFTDHCEPLLKESSDSFQLAEWMHTERSRHHWKYVELRPLSWGENSTYPLVASQSFWFHTLDLVPSLERIFGALHKNSMQRRIRRAERELLSYETGCSEQLLNDFYSLLLITRRRHQLLPQPHTWFRNLIASLGQNVQLRVARKDGIPVAAIMTLRHRTTVVYKYGCSNERFHHLAAMPFLFWKLIEESKSAGAEQIDFGRTDLDNDGLIAFKDRFGTARKRLTYLRYPESAKEKGVMASDLPAVRRLLSVLPDVFLPWAGRLVYRHIG
jgi:CelD/BcsL family acetyltransferase involved in cellulose biosynthesis